MREDYILRANGNHTANVVVGLYLVADGTFRLIIPGRSLGRPNARPSAKMLAESTIQAAEDSNASCKRPAAAMLAGLLGFHQGKTIRLAVRGSAL